jgi:nucleotide-sensitive chloride channel 1A
MFPELWEEETIDYTLDDVEINFSADKPPVGTGKLFITSKRVIWLGKGDEAYDFDVPYIVLHAVTRDADSYPKPCIYCQLDCEEADDNEDDEEEESEEVLDEMFLVPSSEEHLTAMFNALSAAALNNPDPEEDWAQEGDDELIYNAEEVELGAEQARTLEHLESVFNIPEGYGMEAEGEEEGDYEEGEEEGEGEEPVPGQFDDK